MEVYQCCFTNKDVFSSGFKWELVDDLYYVVEGQIINVDNSISDALIGANRSAEAEDEADTDDQPELKGNLINQFLLKKIPSIGSKKEYKKKISAYCKKLIEHVAKHDPERAVVIKPKLNELVVKTFLPKFDSLEFYAAEGDEYDLDGVIIHYEQDDQYGFEKIGNKCRIMVLKDSLNMVKY